MDISKSDWNHIHVLLWPYSLLLLILLLIHYVNYYTLCCSSGRRNNLLKLFMSCHDLPLATCHTHKNENDGNILYIILITSMYSTVSLFADTSCRSRKYTRTVLVLVVVQRTWSLQVTVGYFLQLVHGTSTSNTNEKH